MSSAAHSSFRPHPRLHDARGTIVLVAVAILGVSAGYAAHHGPVVSHSALAVVATALAVSLVAAVVAGARAGHDAVVVVRETSPTLTPPSSRDLAFAAELYRSELGHGFFAKLGPRFARQYLEAYATSPHAVAIVASADGVPVGFLVGALRHRSHRRWVLQNRGLRLGLTGAVALVFRPLLLWSFAARRARRYVRSLHASRGEGADPAQGSESAVLDHVAVIGAARGMGVGEALVTAFVDGATDAGVASAYLCTLEGAEGAGAFYEHLGWRASKLTSPPGGPLMREWTLDLRRPS